MHVVSRKYFLKIQLQYYSTIQSLLVVVSGTCTNDCMENHSSIRVTENEALHRQKQNYVDPNQSPMNVLKLIICCHALLCHHMVYKKILLKELYDYVYDTEKTFLQNFSSSRSSGISRKLDEMFQRYQKQRKVYKRCLNICKLFFNTTRYGTRAYANIISLFVSLLSKSFVKCFSESQTTLNMMCLSIRKRYIPNEELKLYPIFAF